MAVCKISKPGTRVWHGNQVVEVGPCENPCTHSSCAWLRDVAESPCRLCKTPIGYDTPFFEDPDDGTVGHERCELERLEAKHGTP